MSIDLEAAVSAAAKTMEGWRANIAAIEARIADAHSRLDRAGEIRKRHALDASLGDPAAIKEIAKARAESDGAASDLADLDQALADAKLKLIEAEKAAVSTKVALNNFVADGIKREVVEDDDAQIDIVIADLTRLVEKRAQKLTKYINLDVMPRTMHGMINTDEVHGMRRLAAAMRPLLLKISPNMPRDDVTEQLPLAVADRRYFGLGDEPAKTAATKAA
jgi:hypothetical protein